MAKKSSVASILQKSQKLEFRVYEIITNDGLYFVHISEQSLYDRMAKYIRAKRAAGMAFSAILFCFRRVRTTC